MWYQPKEMLTSPDQIRSDRRGGHGCQNESTRLLSIDPADVLALLATLEDREHFRAKTPSEGGKTQGTLFENALVLLKDDHTLPIQWQLGRIMHLQPGLDGICRVATIKTSTGIVKRGFQKICPLPLKFWKRVLSRWGGCSRCPCVLRAYLSTTHGGCEGRPRR
ncbi:hypothetical protein JTB14_024403 [Gonioctena quinquepunctata]|nr:hypothetical protein JTB14_024403 [Gonioctena quinquepunctata]